MVDIVAVPIWSDPVSNLSFHAAMANATLCHTKKAPRKRGRAWRQANIIST